MVPPPPPPPPLPSRREEKRAMNRPGGHRITPSSRVRHQSPFRHLLPPYLGACQPRNGKLVPEERAAELTAVIAAMAMRVGPGREASRGYDLVPFHPTGRRYARRDHIAGDHRPPALWRVTPTPYWVWRTTFLSRASRRYCRAAGNAYLGGVLDALRSPRVGFD